MFQFQPLSSSCLQIADMSVWHEVISQGKTTTNGDEQASSAGLLAGNVYSFGALLLEIISGKLPTPYPAHARSLQVRVSSVTTTKLSMEWNTVMFLTTRRRHTKW